MTIQTSKAPLAASSSPPPGELLTAPDLGEVGELARHGAIWSLLLNVSRHVLSIGSTAVLARLLTPQDYGILGMVATLTIFLQTFADGGLSWATVQRRELSRGQVDNLFWTNTLVGVVLWVGCILAAPALEWFYGRSELPAVAVVLGASFLTSAVAVQPAALMQRQMRFKEISWIEFVAFFVSVAVGVGLAISGLGYWALVGQALAMQFVRLVLFLVVSKYRPAWPRRHQGTLDLLRFGAYAAAWGMVNYFAWNLDKVLLGRIWGAEELGYYTRAYFLSTVPTLLATGSLIGVMVPALSALQASPERMGKAYRKAVTMIAFVAFPAAAGLAVIAPEAVRLVYGPQWLSVIPMLVWLAVAGIALPIHSTITWLFMASGKSRAMFGWGLIAASVFSAGFAVGIRWGGVGVAIANALLMTFVLTIPALYYAHRAAGLQLWLTLSPLVPILAATLCMTTTSYVAGMYLASLGIGWLGILAGKILTGMVVYLIAGLVLIHPLPLAPLENRKLAILGKPAG